MTEVLRWYQLALTFEDQAEPVAFARAVLALAADAVNTSQNDWHELEPKVLQAVETLREHGSQIEAGWGLEAI